MFTRHKRAAAAGAVALLAIAGGGAAVAATGSGSPQADSNAIVADAASQLGITPAKLSDALRRRSRTASTPRSRRAAHRGAGQGAQGADRGRQRAARRRRRRAGRARRAWLPPPWWRPGLDAAATYLGVTEAQLHTALESGKTLADVAKANGKTVDGLVAAMVADAKQHIADEVAAGRLTKAQQTQILSDLEQHITGMVNGQMPDHGPGGRGFGPPPAAPQASPCQRDDGLRRLMDPARPSRIEEARRRASRAKTALGAGAAAVFLAVGALAWVTHPGTSRSSQATSGSPSVSTDDGFFFGSSDDGSADDSGYGDDSNFNYGSGSVAPSGGSQPQVGTSVS